MLSFGSTHIGLIADSQLVRLGLSDKKSSAVRGSEGIMDSSQEARLADAIRLIETALDLLDDADAPADIGARLAEALSRLNECAASPEVIQPGDATNLPLDNNGLH
jgi:hypothetical protein